MLQSQVLSSGLRLGCSSLISSLQPLAAPRQRRALHRLAGQMLSARLLRPTMPTLSARSSIQPLARLFTHIANQTPRPALRALPVQQQRAHLFGFGDSELEEALDKADDNPDNAKYQAEAMRLLAEEHPDDAIKRYRSGRFAVDDAVTKHYIAALVRADKLKNENLSTLFPAATAQAAGIGGPVRDSLAASYSSARAGAGSTSGMGGSRGGFGGGRQDGSGTAEEPFVVAMTEPSMKTQFWRLLRTVLFLLILLSAMNQAVDERGLGGRAMGADNEVRPETQEHHYTFEDVQGADEAKEELMDVVEFLRHPDQFTRLGGKLPKGVLLVGPPGTGKTLLARAVAGEAGVPFFYCSGSEFDEMFVGVGARRVRELFTAAKKKAPCIIFMDEIDAVGSRRSGRDQSYSKMTLNQLLVELDGFNSSDKVIVVAATNFPESLDPALIRPGRFDTHIKVPLPDVRGRLKILERHASKVELSNTKDLWTIARGTVGFSGAELANLINQAALQASRMQQDNIDLATLEWAKDKILMGAERKQAVITEKDKSVTAYHEGGHALCALYAKGAVPVYKATIVPRGNALGMVTQLPEDDTNSLTREQMMARMVVAMGGRAAEEKIFGYDQVTSGASSDVEQATKMARTMVTKYAMSDKVGPMMFEDEDKISDSTRAVIEAETKKLLDEAMRRAVEILTKHEREHHRLAKALLEHETLTAEQMRMVIKGKTLPKKDA
eukprot:TRINITY_DN4503_c0_g1_i2.p1 TRINITY_DN4503_c0_g1~~TRINITY_DN4503_c0_g1_i2.p1  ORF type:complete len:724 (+),score=203.51 TRINITY_DN4503_c0_g1_i2:112-2283(+)